MSTPTGSWVSTRRTRIVIAADFEGIDDPPTTGQNAPISGTTRHHQRRVASRGCYVRRHDLRRLSRRQPRGQRRPRLPPALGLDPAGRDGRHDPVRRPRPDRRSVRRRPRRSPGLGPCPNRRPRSTPTRTSSSPPAPASSRAGVLTTARGRTSPIRSTQSRTRRPTAPSPAPAPRGSPGFNAPPPNNPPVAAAEGLLDSEEHTNWSSPLRASSATTPTPTATADRRPRGRCRARHPDARTRTEDSRTTPTPATTVPTASPTRPTTEQMTRIPSPCRWWSATSGSPSMAARTLATGRPGQAGPPAVHHRDLVQADRTGRRQHDRQRRDHQPRPAPDPRCRAGRGLERRRQLDPGYRHDEPGIRDRGRLRRDRRPAHDRPERPDQRHDAHHRQRCWHHAAATFDGTTFAVYLDGNLEASVDPGFHPRWDSIQPVAMGAMIQSGTLGPTAGRFEGVLDEARVWDHARIGDRHHRQHEPRAHLRHRPRRALGS